MMHTVGTFLLVSYRMCFSRFLPKKNKLSPLDPESAGDAKGRDPLPNHTREVAHSARAAMDDTLAARFADVIPIEQEDGPTPVVRIAYSPAFSLVMGYFRRVLVDEEYSERALALSAEVIDHNAANYTAWQYRRQCVARLHVDAPEEQRLAAWREELDFCTEQLSLIHI